MSMDVDPEKEKEIIEKIARYVVDKDMETQAIFVLESHKPLSFIMGQMGLFYLSPFLNIMPPELSYTSNQYLYLFQKRETFEKIILRIEELSNEKARTKKQVGRESKGILKKVKDFFLS